MFPCIPQPVSCFTLGTTCLTHSSQVRGNYTKSCQSKSRNLKTRDLEINNTCTHARTHACCHMHARTHKSWPSLAFLNRYIQSWKVICSHVYVLAPLCWCIGSLVCCYFNNWGGSRILWEGVRTHALEACVPRRFQGQASMRNAVQSKPLISPGSVTRIDNDLMREET